MFQISPLVCLCSKYGGTSSNAVSNAVYSAVQMKVVNTLDINVKVNARLPIMPIKINLQTGSKIVYALLDSGSDESIISIELYDNLTLTGENCKCVLVTADNKKSILNTVSTSFKVGAFNGVKTHLFKDALAINNLPDISNCLPSARNIEHVA